jgi:7tm Chemosensory receptor
MNGISSLDGVFKIFEITKMQNFSLKSVVLDSSAQQRCSFASTAYSVLVWIVLTASVLFLAVVRPVYDKDFKEQSIVHFLVKCIVMGNSFASMYASLIVSIVKNQHFVKFFKGADQISRICEQEFGHRVKYDNLKRKFHVTAAVIISVFLLGILLILASLSSQPVEIMAMIIVSMISSFFLCLIGLKFYFYVEVVNFQLRLFNQLLENSFSGSLNLIKVLHLRRIFTIIRDMVQQVNKSMSIYLGLYPLSRFDELHKI